ncbi:MAG: phenylacetate--CoA ligase family protein [Candidatus Freyarchaeota archaeon]
MSRELWNPLVETMPREELEALQLKFIKSQVSYVYSNSSWHHKLYKEANVTPEDIQTIDDFKQKIPIYDKDDLREEQRKTGDPFSGLCCVPREELVNVWTSSGTTGMPTLGAYTRNDLYIASEIMCRALWDGGFRPGMKAFSASINWHWVMPHVLNASHRLGLRTMAFDFPHPLFVDRWARWMILHKPEAIPSVTTEVFAAFLPAALKQLGYEPSEVLSCVKLAVPMGEPLSPVAREHVKKNWPNVRIRDAGGCGESYCWPVEICDEHVGGHIWIDMGLPEVLDPDTREPVAPGERGEMVATNLRVKGLPYIRFSTEDFIELTEETCERGITHPYGRILARTGWRTKISEKTFIPFDVEVILQRHPETMKAMFSTVKYSEKMDRLQVNVAYDPAVTKDPEKLKAELTEEMERELGVKVEINWVKEEEIPRPVPHKIAKFVDLTKA